MEIAVERLVALCFLITGISHVAQPRAWVELFIRWRELGHVGSLLNALLNLPLGAVIVCFHNVWHGGATLITILGWCLVLKATIYFTLPALGTRMLGHVSVERSWEFVVAGIFSIALAGAIFWYSLR